MLIQIYVFVIAATMAVAAIFTDAAAAEKDLERGAVKAENAALVRSKNPLTGMEFVFVPGGCFSMGSDKGNSDEKPVHEVCVSGGEF